MPRRRTERGSTSPTRRFTSSPTSTSGRFGKWSAFPAAFNGWSARRNRIAFTRHEAIGETGASNIYVMNADGSDLQNVTNSTSRNEAALRVRGR